MGIELLKPLFDVDTSIVGWRQKSAFSLDKSPARYAGWQHYARDNQLLPVEYLIPRLYCPFPSPLPPSMPRPEDI